MSMQTIEIFQQWPVINGFVRVPPAKETDKTRVTVNEALVSIAGSTEIELSAGSGYNTGGKQGSQHILRLPAIIPGNWYATNPVDDVAGD